MNYKDKQQKGRVHLTNIFIAFFIISASFNAFATQSSLNNKTASKSETAVAATVAADQTALNNVTNLNTQDLNAPLGPQADLSDPLEKFNRGVFVFNDKIDTFILKPVATFYNAIMPRPLNQGVHNFFSNIGNLPTIANDLLQLNFYQASNDFWRLAINTTAGIGGLFDVADRVGLKPYTNDFGLTLAKWGWNRSTYLVLPFFGPNTVRDGIGLPVDYYAFSIYPYIKPVSTRYELYGLGVVDRRAQLLQFESVMEEAALDKYTFVRNAYMQRRAFQIKENKQFSANGACEEGPTAEVTTTSSNQTLQISSN